LTSDTPAPDNKHLTSDTPAPDNKNLTSDSEYLTSDTPAPDNKHLTSITPAPDNKHLTSDTPAPDNKHLTSDTPAPDNKHLTSDTPAPDNKHLTSDSEYLTSDTVHFPQAASPGVRGATPAVIHRARSERSNAMMEHKEDLRHITTAAPVSADPTARNSSEAGPSSDPLVTTSGTGDPIANNPETPKSSPSADTNPDISSDNKTAMSDANSSGEKPIVEESSTPPVPVPYTEETSSETTSTDDTCEGK
jgi:hypothetical protein